MEVSYVLYGRAESETLSGRQCFHLSILLKNADTRIRIHLMPSFFCFVYRLCYGLGHTPDNDTVIYEESKFC